MDGHRNEPTVRTAARQMVLHLGLGPLQAKDVAVQLGMARRQLIRRLHADGVNWQALVDELRFARARQLLDIGNASACEFALALLVRHKT
jgi:transcriptional regulator GlxA family with amidase domain